MKFEIKKMETDDEIRGKAYVHWKSWHEAYPGLVDQGDLDAMTITSGSITLIRNLPRSQG